MQVAAVDDEVTERIQASRMAVEALESSTPQRELVFQWIKPNGEPVEKHYIQAELGMYPIQEFTTRVTEVLDSFTKGDLGIQIGELFRGEIEMPVDLSADSAQSFVDDNIALIQAFFKLLQMVPDLELDIMCLSLGVPRLERDWAKEQLAEPPHRGGLTVIEGFDILIHFVIQNAELLRETLLGKARELVDGFRLHVLKQDLTTTSSNSTDSEATASTAVASVSPPSSLGGTPSSTSSSDTPGSD